MSPPEETTTQRLAGNRKVFTVSRLNQDVQSLLETDFGTLWLQGELSNFSRPGSGHFYFTLKDSRSQIRCAMFKGRNRYVDFNPENGESVLVRGKLGLYAARGDFQLIVEHMEPAGAGRLQAAFEANKRKLDALGWFDTKTKKALPRLPQTIGVVTSPTGAALRDVLHVLSRRYRQARVIIYPTLTQGAAASPAIVKALGQANERNEVDVLLLVRGGGSLEDLWAFNEVDVASAIRASNIPVVAGIGHEVDVTISDLVADLRAPTPSAAAELATPDTSALQMRVVSAARQLLQLQSAQQTTLARQLKQLNTRLELRHPERQLHEQTQRMDELQRRLHSSWARVSQQNQARHSAIEARLHVCSPANKVQQQKSSLTALNQRLESSTLVVQNSARSRFEVLARALSSVNPLAVLDRGYAVIKKQQKVILNVDDISLGDKISGRVATGEFTAIVESKQAKEL